MLTNPTCSQRPIHTVTTDLLAERHFGPTDRIRDFRRDARAQATVQRPLPDLSDKGHSDQISATHFAMFDIAPAREGRHSLPCAPALNRVQIQPRPYLFTGPRS